MKLYKEEVEILSSGVSEGVEATIKASAHAFAVLSKGLYSDPFLAIVRELCCNAWDAHVAAGTTDQQFLVQFPTHFEPTFMVRDYGTGLPDEASVFRMYRYFDSSKQQSDTMTGCFGLGAKSPYAYTQKFTTKNFFNGKEHHYISYLNEAGVPHTVKIAENDTTEPNGLEVSFSVSSDDFYKFRNAGHQALRWFEHKPRIRGVSEYQVIADQRSGVLLEGSDWKCFGSGSGVAIMGNVAYPLVGYRGLSHNAAAVVNFDLELRFPLGAFEITPSREAIQWTDYSIAAINDKLEEVYDAAIEHCSKKIEDAKTYWQACQFAHALKHSCFGPLMNDVVWGNRKVSSVLDIPDDIILLRMCASRTTKRYADYNRVTSHPIHSLSPHQCLVTPKFFFADYKSAEQRMEKIVKYEMTRGEEVLLIKGFKDIVNAEGKTERVSDFSPQHVKNFLEAMGLEESCVETVSSIPPKPRADAQRNSHLAGSKFKTFEFVHASKDAAARNFWTEQTVDLDDGGVYVAINFWQLEGSANAHEPNVLKTLLSTLSTLHCTVPTITGVKQANVAKFEKHPKWKHLDKWVDDTLEELLTPEFMRAYHILCGHYSSCGRAIESMSERVDWFHWLLSMPATSAPFTALQAEIKPIYDLRNRMSIINTSELFVIQNKLAKLSADGSNLDVKSFLDKTAVTYPMLLAGSRTKYNSFPTKQMYVDYIHMIDKKEEEKTCPSTSGSI